MKLFRKNDIILIISALAVALAAFFAISAFSAVGGSITIEQNGEIVKTMPLNVDAEYNLRNADGEICNTVQVKNGCVSVVYADCPDKICKNHKKISKSGESIVCLPNKVIITVVENGDEPDGVAK